jgi:uncharacterized protein (TIGR02757 family)
MKRISNNNLPQILDSLYDTYNRREYIASDPEEFIYEYPEPADMEAVGFIACCFAYGRVAQFKKALRFVFDQMGASPAAFVHDFRQNQRKRFAGFKHRFNTENDLCDMLTVIRHILRNHDSIESFFAGFYKDTDVNVIPAMTGFCGEFARLRERLCKNPPDRGFGYLIPDPARKSPCKRMNMFLRWMVRDDEVDPGLWKSIPASKLVVPMDTHLARITRILGFHAAKTVNLKTAAEVTAKFAQICPEDPVKYDFCLSRIGIVEGCTGKRSGFCPECGLSGFCE